MSCTSQTYVVESAGLSGCTNKNTGIENSSVLTRFWSFFEESASFRTATSQRPAIQKAFCKKGLAALDLRYKTVVNY